MSNGFLIVAEADRAAAYDLSDGFGLDVIGAATLGDLDATLAALAHAPNVGIVLSHAAAQEANFVALLQALAQRLGGAQLIVVEPDARAAFAFLPSGWPEMSFALAHERASELMRRRQASDGATEPPHAAPLPPTPPPEAPPPAVEPEPIIEPEAAAPEPAPEPEHSEQQQQQQERVAPVEEAEPESGPALADEVEAKGEAPAPADEPASDAEALDQLEPSAGDDAGLVGAREPQGEPEVTRGGFEAEAPAELEPEAPVAAGAPPVVVEEPVAAAPPPALEDAPPERPAPAPAAPIPAPPQHSAPPAAEAPPPLQSRAPEENDAAAPPQKKSAPAARSRTAAASAPADATAFAPKKVRRGTPELVRVAIHQPKDLKAVIKAARQIDPRTEPAPQGMSIGDVALGASVGVSLEVRGAACDGAVQRRTWRGDPIDFNFSVEADADVKQIVVLARVFVDDAQIGVLAFTRPVIGADKKAQGDGDKVRLKRHKRVFLSYSSTDRETVAAIATAYASAGVEHFWDRTSLKSGEEWSPRLRKEIERADLFHLCWSKSAATSEWVEKEATYALTRRRRAKKPEITVQMLDGPPWAKHPDSLDSINFDDFVRAAIVGYARGDGEA